MLKEAVICIDDNRAVDNKLYRAMKAWVREGVLEK